MYEGNEFTVDGSGRNVLMLMDMGTSGTEVIRAMRDAEKNHRVAGQLRRCLSSS